MNKTALLLGLLLCFHLSFAQVNSKVIPFDLLESGHILIKAEIDGIEGNFILDTGAGINVVFRNFATKIQRNATTNFFVGHRATGEALKVEFYKTSSLNIGQKKFNDQRYAIFDMDLGEIDGLISLEPFRNTPFTINYINKTIVLEQKKYPVGGEKSIEIQISDFAGRAIDIYTNVMLNDSITVQVQLDSGAGSNSFWLDLDYLSALGLNKDDFKRSSKTSDFNPTQTNDYYAGSLRSIKIDNSNCKVENAKVLFVEGMIHEGKTGIDWLGKVITIDIPQKKIFVHE